MKLMRNFLGMLILLLVLPLFTHSAFSQTQDLPPTGATTSAEPSEPSNTLVPTLTLTPTASPASTLEATPTAALTSTPTSTLAPTSTVTPASEKSTENVFQPTAISDEDNVSKNVKEFKPNKKNYIDGEVLVKFKSADKASFSSIKDKNQKIARISSTYSLTKKNEFVELGVVHFKGNESTDKLINKLIQDGDVEYVEPNYLRQLAVTPTDTNFSYQWALNNTGQSVNGYLGTNDADIDAPEAWDLETAEQTDVIVAVIDTGAVLDNADIHPNLWDGSSGCLDENNASISGGCPYHGWDYAYDDNAPWDDYGHGTHVASIIGARANNGIDGSRMTGLSYYNNIKLMIVRAGSISGLDTAAVVNGILFAKNNGAEVINASFGGQEFSQTEKNAIDSFNGLFVAAAGNEGTNNDITPFYPCSHTSTNIVCVASSDSNDQLSTFSNYGSTSVDIAAPGENIYGAHLGTYTGHSEDFTGLASYSIPPEWTRTGNFGVISNFDHSNNYLYGDYLIPYTSNKDYQTTSQSISFSAYNEGYMGLDMYCDTEYSLNTWEDYLTLWMSGNNGSSWTKIQEFDESFLDYYSGDTSSAGVAHYNFTYIHIPTELMTDQFKFMLSWHSDGDTNNGSYGSGCYIKEVRVVQISGSYPTWMYMSGGTSMAAPYVAGAAALALSYNPSISTSQLKAFILNSGDKPAGINDYVSSDQRLNAYQLLRAVTPDMVYRFWNQIEGNHFYTINKNEWLEVITLYPTIWKYEGTAYPADSVSRTGNTALYRFWNQISGQHFYTASNVEKNWLIATYPTIWRYEGIAYYILPLNTSEPSSTIFRFWRPEKNHHFYTASTVERDWILLTYPTIWTYEGEAFKVSAQ